MAPAVQHILQHKTLGFLALLLWLIASWVGAHGHMCFDGKEPPVTVHMDMLSDHPVHSSDEQHVDADLNLGQLALAKISKIDLPLLVVTALLFALLFTPTADCFVCYSRTLPTDLTPVRPPSRAPPVFPA